MKKCLIVCSEPFYWDEHIAVIKEAGFECTICLSGDEAYKSLQKNNFDFAMVSNTLDGLLPAEGEFSQRGIHHDFHSVGTKYIAPMMEKFKVPFVLLGTARRPSKNGFPHCLWADHVSSLSLAETKEIIKKLPTKR